MRAAPLRSMRLPALIGILALSGQGGNLQAEPSSGTVSPLLEKHLVDIGNGRRINLVCFGHGTPTVVFEYGLGGHMLNWQKVQPAISALTTSCFYDRTGYGYSDPSSRASTAQGATDDLYWLLRKANIDRPVVLVAHSLGGLDATLYADRFPSDVAGLVLVDPLFTGQDLDETPEERQRVAAVYERSQAAMVRCGNLARQHQLSAADGHACFQIDSKADAEQSRYLLAQYTSASRWDAMLSESRNVHAAGTLSEDEVEEQRAAASWSEKPVIVLTAGLAPKEPDETEDEHCKNMAHWKAGHDRLAARSSRGESVVVPGATHMIQLDQPDVVIDAVRQVVLALRNPQAPANRRSGMAR